MKLAKYLRRVVGMTDIRDQGVHKTYPEWQHDTMEMAAVRHVTPSLREHIMRVEIATVYDTKGEYHRGGSSRRMHGSKLRDAPAKPSV